MGLWLLLAAGTCKGTALRMQGDSKKRKRSGNESAQLAKKPAIGVAGEEVKQAANNVLQEALAHHIMVPHCTNIVMSYLDVDGFLKILAETDGGDEYKNIIEDLTELVGQQPALLQRVTLCIAKKLSHLTEQHPGIDLKVYIKPIVDSFFWVVNNNQKFWGKEINSAISKIEESALEKSYSLEEDFGFKPSCAEKLLQAMTALADEYKSRPCSQWILTCMLRLILVAAYEENDPFTLDKFVYEGFNTLLNEGGKLYCNPTTSTQTRRQLLEIAEVVAKWLENDVIHYREVEEQITQEQMSLVQNLKKIAHLPESRFPALTQLMNELPQRSG